MSSGKKIESDYPLEVMLKIVAEEHGRVKAIARRCQCSVNTIYDYIDCYPELQDARKKAQKRGSLTLLEHAEMTTEKLMNFADEKPEVASRLAMFVMKHNKHSDYRDTNVGEDHEGQHADHLLSRLERYISESTSQS